MRTLFQKLGFRIITALASMLVLSVLSLAQNGPDHRFTFNVGGGVTPVTGDIDNRLTTGWNFSVGGGLNVNNPFAVMLQFDYNGLGVSRAVLNQLQVPNGNAHIYSVTIDPMLRIGADHTITPYVIGGGGFYRRTVQFTQPTTAVVPFFDPWFGFFGSAIVPANQVLGTFSHNAGGFNVGGGLTYKIGTSGMKIYSEARYNWMSTNRTPTTFIPVTFGIRW